MDEISKKNAEMSGLGGQSWMEKQMASQLRKDLKKVDHSKMDYQPFQKNFYVEAAEITAWDMKDVEQYRENELEGVKIRGVDCPKPIKKWTQCGLPSKVLDIITREAYKAPFPIQACAIPAIMSGRDIIACAKTGSGKTLAFVLPMLRHIMLQDPLGPLDGPIGVIMAPTRELAVQIHTEVKKFCRPLGLRAAAVYGGASISEQIAQLKGGAEIIVATPGRLIDILCANSGRVTNLTRTTMIVMDEADRMFDMGFEPQITKILDNIRPDRQTVMFSATFPPSVEKLAKKVLKKPLEIIIGGRSVASSNIEQIIEVRPPEQRFRRLLELLGLWYDKGNVLIFEDKQDNVDKLFQELMDAGYLALALHGGMDQEDRDSTIEEFRRKERTLMVATSIAARGLDVKDLVLVVNYSCPNHYEDYVHRIGRTGRAGNKGTAVTFIAPDEAQYASDLVRGLEAAKQEVPAELRKLSEEHEEKVKKGEAKKHASGFGGRGFKFDEDEAKANKMKELQQRSGYGLDDDAQMVVQLDLLREAAGTAPGAGNADGSDDEGPTAASEGVRAVVKEAGAGSSDSLHAALEEAKRRIMSTVGASASSSAAAGAGSGALSASVAAMTAGVSASSLDMAPPGAPASAEDSIAAQLEAIKAAALAARTTLEEGGDESAARAVVQAAAKEVEAKESAREGTERATTMLRVLQVRAALERAAVGQTAPVPGMTGLANVLALASSGGGAGALGAGGVEEKKAEVTHFAAEFEINDYPQQARWMVTKKGSLDDVLSKYEVSVTTKGTYIASGRKPQPGEQKIYLLIEGTSETNVARAKAEIRRMMEETALGLNQNARASAGRYKVV